MRLCTNVPRRSGRWIAIAVLVLDLDVCDCWTGAKPLRPGDVPTHRLREPETWQPVRASGTLPAPATSRFKAMRRTSASTRVRRSDSRVNSTSSNYTVDIYRLGYYAGLGARKVASVLPSAALPQAQPACLSDATTGLIDCGNWAESASWAVPATATSGIYIAKLTRGDTGGASHMVFVVRSDTGGSDLLFQTSDTTWQAYTRTGVTASMSARRRGAPTRSVTTGLSALANPIQRTFCSTLNTRWCGGWSPTATT